MLAGTRTFAAEPGPRLVISLFGCQAFVRGILNVLLVVTAFRLLDTGDSGVGLLNAAFGLGGLVGGLAGIGLVGLRRLARPFAGGLVLWGARSRSSRRGRTSRGRSRAWWSSARGTRSSTSRASR